MSFFLAFAMIFSKAVGGAKAKLACFYAVMFFEPYLCLSNTHLSFGTALIYGCGFVSPDLHLSHQTSFCKPLKTTLDI